MRLKGRRRFSEERPRAPTVSTMRRDWSNMMRVNRGRMPPGEKVRRLRDARAHLDFVRSLCRDQHKRGYDYIHEHLAQAESWEEDTILQLRREIRGFYITFDMCQYEVISWDGEGRPGPATTSTTLLTNMPALKTELGRRCSGHHQHSSLEGSTPGRGPWTRRAQLSHHVHTCDPQGCEEAIPMDVSEESRDDGNAIPADEEYAGHADISWDDITGSYLVPKAVRAARAEETKYYREMGACEVVTIDEFWKATGKAPIGVRWLDHDKGDAQRPNVRWMLVAQDYTTEKNADLFAGPPPLESIKLVLSNCVSGSRTRCVMVNDPSRAYPHAPCRWAVFVARCPEAKNAGEDPECRTCWRLLKSMYGTRPAAQDWQHAVRQALEKRGFTAGRSSANVYSHAKMNIWTFVHGDDFASLGELADLRWLEVELGKIFLVTTEIPGPHTGLKREVRVLDRLAEFCDGHGLAFEADPRHVQTMVEDVGAREQKPLKTPGVTLVRRGG